MAWIDLPTLHLLIGKQIIAVVKYPEGDPNQPKTRSRTNNISETSSGGGGNLLKENKELKHTIKDVSVVIQQTTYYFNTGYWIWYKLMLLFAIARYRGSGF